MPQAQLIVGGENGLLYLVATEGKVSAPAGKYRLTTWRIERTDDSGATWRAEGTVIPGEAAVFEVNEGKETRLAVGEPFVCKKGTDTPQDRGTHILGLRLRGRLGGRPNPCGALRWLMRMRKLAYVRLARGIYGFRREDLAALIDAGRVEAAPMARKHAVDT